MKVKLTTFHKIIMGQVELVIGVVIEVKLGNKLVLGNIALTINNNLLASWKVKAGLIKVWNTNQVLPCSRSNRINS